MELFYFIYVDEDEEDDDEVFTGNLVVSNHYFEQFDMCYYLN